MGRNLRTDGSGAPGDRVTAVAKSGTFFSWLTTHPPNPCRSPPSSRAEFEQALQYHLTDEDLERAKVLLGVDTASRHRELYSVATPDAIRNWALGVGDDNPLYTDEEYGPTTRWGTQIGHGTMMGHVKTPDARRPDPRRDQAADQEPVPRRARVRVGRHVGLVPAVAPRRSHLLVLGRRVARGEEVGVRRDAQRCRCGATSRSTSSARCSACTGSWPCSPSARRRAHAASTRRSNPRTTPTRTTSASTRSTRRSSPRGAEKRYWEDVDVGDELPPMVKGPLTVTEIIAFHAGGYGFVPYGLRSSRVGYKNRLRIAPFYIKNERGVWDVAQRLHWDYQWAKAIGNPLAYDYGVLRQAWFYHHVADWAGDDGFIEKMSDSIRKFNYHGDTQFLSGEVVAKREEDGRYLVDLEAVDGEPARRRDRVRHRDGVVAVTDRGAAADAAHADRPAAPGGDDVRPPQRAHGPEAGLTLTVRMMQPDDALPVRRPLHHRRRHPPHRAPRSLDRAGAQGLRGPGAAGARGRRRAVVDDGRQGALACGRVGRRRCRRREGARAPRSSSGTSRTSTPRPTTSTPASR